MSTGPFKLNIWANYFKPKEHNFFPSRSDKSFQFEILLKKYPQNSSNPVKGIFQKLISGYFR